MDVLFLKLVAQQGRHGFRIKTGLVAVKELRHGAGNLLPQGQNRNAHGAGPPQPVQRPARCMAWMVWKKSFSLAVDSCVIHCGSRLSAMQ